MLRFYLGGAAIIICLLVALGAVYAKNAPPSDSTLKPSPTIDIIPTINATLTAEKPSSSASAYPQEAVDGYVSSCVAGGAPRSQCTCQIGKIEARFTYQQFMHPTADDPIQAAMPALAAACKTGA